MKEADHSRGEASSQGVIREAVLKCRVTSVVLSDHLNRQGRLGSELQEPGTRITQLSRCFLNP